jgi:hypothetical protein
MQVCSDTQVRKREIPTLRLLYQASWSAEKCIKSRRGLVSMLWLTEDAAGKLEKFETPCIAPRHVEEGKLLDALCSDMRSEFSEKGVVRFAVAFVGDRTDLSERFEVVALESHNTGGIHVGAHREVYHACGRRLLGPLSPLERLTRSRYLDLLG